MQRMAYRMFARLRVEHNASWPGNQREVTMVQKILTLGMASLLSFPLSTAAQLPRGQGTPPAEQVQNQKPIQTVTTRVIVPVTVKDHGGHLIGDLQKDEFRVLVDGIDQKILTFASDPSPLSAVILIDNDLAQKQAEEIQKSLTTISAGFGPSDEAALVTFSEYPTTIQEFSSNNDDLFTKLKRLQVGSHSSSVATRSSMEIRIRLMRRQRDLVFPYTDPSAIRPSPLLMTRFTLRPTCFRTTKRIVGRLFS
jgi:hypothetical protein